MRIRRILITCTAMGALAVCLAQPATAAASPGAVARAATGCAGMTIKAPRAGTAVSAASMGMPAGTAGFYARAAANHATWLTDLSCTRTGLTHPYQPAQSASGIGRSAIANSGIRNNLVSSNWSGYQLGRTSQFVQSGWTVPTVTKPVPAYSTIGYYSSTWTGIGGGFNAGGGPLIQSGTEQEVANSGATTYYFWYEVVGGSGDTGSEVRISMPVHPGDFVGAVSLWSASTGAEMGVCNFSTTNTCVQFFVASSAPGNSTEWIEEAPYNGGVLPLADFGTVRFANACWAPTYFVGLNSCNTISSGAPQGITLQQYVLGAYQNLAIPGAIDSTGGGFPISYYAPVRPDPCPTC
jgi:Peptidase A4 family